MSISTQTGDERARAARWCGAAYAVALIAAIATALLVDDADLQWRTFWADIAATVAVFAFSVALRNSSLYDPYWSVAPMAIAIAWAAIGLGGANAPRALLTTAAVLLWGARLTWNWWRGRGGLAHEDWRYRQIREKTGAFYWPASFLGIHMMPTLLVFLGCLPLYPALVTSSAPFGLLDAIAVLVVATAIWFESEADAQLHRFRLSKPAAGSTLQSGLWARSRHPNYFGEVLFWWGILLFGLAAAPEQWWRGIGALAITLLFRFVSLPLIDARMQERRPDYAVWMTEVPSILPLGRPPRPRRRPEA